MLSEIVSCPIVQLLHRFDASTLAMALHDCLRDVDTRAKMGEAARALAQGPLSWKSAIPPLDAFCRDPHHAADLGDPVLGRTVRRVLNRTDPTGILQRIRISLDTRGGLLGTLLRRPPVH